MLGPYAASKAGVEALTISLRSEMVPAGVGVGAYFGFIDADLVRAGYDSPSSQAMQREVPEFIRRPRPLKVAVDAIERRADQDRSEARDQRASASRVNSRSARICF